MKTIIKKIFIALMIILILSPNMYIFATPPDTENTVGSGDTQPSQTSTTTSSGGGKVVVLDPGHGSSMGSGFNYSANGFIKKSSGEWGEWRHWKSGTYGEECNGSGCCAKNKAGYNTGEWYLASAGLRDTEPELNLNNALAAKKYLEEMGYEVRMTRTDNSTHESFSKRSTYCFPNKDTSKEPDADLYVCIHANARDGATRGSAYMSTSGSTYDQKYIPDNFAEECDKVGEIINNKIISNTSLEAYNGGVISGQPDLIAFHKNPCVTAYLEIGHYDNSSDLGILKSESDAIGKAIADGINEYLGGSGGTSKTRVKSIITPNEEKFLGTWKNVLGEFVEYYNPDGTVNTDALFDPEGKKVEYRTPGGTDLCPADRIESNAELLFELLQKSQRTQQEEKLMRYLLFVYNGKDYGVTEFDFSVFDLNSFSGVGRWIFFFSFRFNFMEK